MGNSLKDAWDIGCGCSAHLLRVCQVGKPNHDQHHGNDVDHNTADDAPDLNDGEANYPRNQRST